MKLINYSIAIFLVVFGWITFAACSKMDDYKKFMANKEILYTGKPDSVETFSGNKRIKISWLKSSDPKVRRTEIFWNNHTDSVVVPADAKKEHIEWQSTIINNLPEGTYNFELINSDEQGHRSVISRVIGTVYGSVYQNSLSSRLVYDFYENEFNVGFYPAVNWFASDVKSVGVELTYKTTTGQTQLMMIKPERMSSLLPGYDSKYPISYRTMYLPDSTSIDTFYTAAVTRTVDVFPADQIHIKNPGNPFKAQTVVGRWGTLSDWITNDPVKNHDGAVGGLDNLNTSNQALMSFEYWGTPAINNGKIYQFGSLPAGNYHLVITTENTSNNLENTYICVANGNIIPDVENIGTSINSIRIQNSQMANKDLLLPFTLAKLSLISFGVSSTMAQVPESSIRIRSFKLFKD